MFYIFLLKLALKEVLVLTQVPNKCLVKQEEWYKVEQILEH